ncbi:sugar phosphate nucleotidyltransferase [Haladaptatus cibarius]|uniref:sugar phosphate nucleotidyltransferase n=1 Tax=Haladaptatus cibarius TaxID=453847 RepID=UPI00067983D5|nr:sugar phosphate nucleotidyltransferase [Haladaptatus cibarius]
MQAVVLAAGKGTRMRPLTDNRPKGLVAVDGKPILTHCFDVLIDAGATELIVVAGYCGEKIVEHYGDSYDGMPVKYAWQNEQLGLAHALLMAEPVVKGDFMLMDGDNIVEGDNLDELVEQQLSGTISGGLLLEEVSREQAKGEGVCRVDDGTVTEIIEKPDDPPSTLVVAGFHTFDERIFDACRLVQPSDRGEYEMSDGIEMLIKGQHNIAALSIDGWRMNINSPEDIEKAEQRL